MIKPDGILREGIIREMIAPLAAILAERLFDPVATSTIECLYATHREKPFYPRLVDFFRGKPVRAFLLTRRPDVVYRNGFYADFLALVGDTDPARAKPGTIRSLSEDSLERSLAEKRALLNLVHRSTTSEETAREAPLFFWDHVCDRGKVPGVPGDLGRFLAKEGEGVFYEERLEQELRKRRLLSPEERLVCFRETGARGGGTSGEGTILVEIAGSGSRTIREATLVYADLPGRVRRLP